MRKYKMFNGEELEIGDEIRFGDLWQSDDGDPDEILDSGCVWIANDKNDAPVIADFIIIWEDNDNSMNTIVKITGIR